MPNSPSNRPTSARTARSALQKNLSEAFPNQESFSMKDPSIVSIKSPRYPPSQTADFIRTHGSGSAVKIASQNPRSSGTSSPSTSAPVKTVNSRSSQSPKPSSSKPSTGFKVTASSIAEILNNQPPKQPAASPIAPSAAPNSAQGGGGASKQDPSGTASNEVIVINAENLPPESTTRTRIVCLSRGLKFQLALGVVIAGIFLSLWIFIMSASCLNHLDLVFWVETFSLIGTLAGLFISIYCFFIGNLGPRRGLTGCLFLTFLVIISGLNFIGAYLAYSKCICTCLKSVTTNFFKDGGNDLVIFIMEIIGSSLILVSLFTASVFE